jgi:hypothetical protein
MLKYSSSFFVHLFISLNFSWLCFYLHQWKPLFGPQFSNDTARMLRLIWGTEL